MGFIFVRHFHYILEVFPSIFFVFFIFKLFVFSDLSYNNYPIYRIFFCEKIGLWFVETTKSCIHPFACGFVPCPLSVEEVMHWIVFIPLSVEVIEFVGIPLVRG